MRVLAVQIDESLADILQLGERRGPAIDPGAAPALGVHRSAQQQRAVVGREVLFGEPGADRGTVTDIESGGELGALGAGFQLPQFEAIAQQQRQRVEQDRLARAGFPGEHREAAVELELE